MLDSDTLILMMRGLRITNPRNQRQRDRQRVAMRIFQRAREAAQSGRVVLSAITVAEIRFGALASNDPARETTYAEQVLAPFVFVDFDCGECASHYARIRSALESRGKAIGPLDTLIAAHASALGAILVTNNTAEFSRVPGLPCENWSRQNSL